MYRICIHPFSICGINWNSIKFLVWQEIIISSFPWEQLFFPFNQNKTCRSWYFKPLWKLNVLGIIPTLYLIIVLTFGSKTAPLHIITDKTSLFSSFIFCRAFFCPNVADVFLMHLFQLEACLDRGINRIAIVVKQKGKSPRYIIWIKSFLRKFKRSNQ